MAESSERMNKIRAMLEKQPNDTELLYCMAMEYKKVNDPTKAIEYLDGILGLDPGYCYAYYQKGQIQEQAGDTEAAKRTWRDGIAAADRKGDAHARSEIQAALDMIE